MKSIHFTPIVGLGLCLLASACKAPVHLSYDFGRAYHNVSVQSDLTRESVLTYIHWVVLRALKLSESHRGTTTPKTPVQHFRDGRQLGRVFIGTRLQIAHLLLDNGRLRGFSLLSLSYYTAVALYVCYSDAERVLAERQSAAAAPLAQVSSKSVKRAGLDPTLPVGSRNLLKVDSIYAQRPDGTIFFAEGMDAPPVLLDRVCSQEIPTLYTLNNTSYVFACEAKSDYRVITAMQPEQVAIWRITGLVC